MIKRLGWVIPFRIPDPTVVDAGEVKRRWTRESGQTYMFPFTGISFCYFLIHGTLLVFTCLKA